MITTSNQLPILTTNYRLVALEPELLASLTQYAPDSVHIEEHVEYGRTVLWVFLDGCYAGDMAVVDTAAEEVIDFGMAAIA
jgi:hypothetical protein